MRLTLKKPYQPFPDIPKTVTEVRLWIVPLPNGGAQVFAEGDCATAGDAADASAHLNKVADRYRGGGLVSLGIAMATGGLLSSLDIQPNDTHVELKLTATEEQLDLLLKLVGGQISSMKQPAAPPTKVAPR
jgi:hypothetical protein